MTESAFVASAGGPGQSLKQYRQEALQGEDFKPGEDIAVQTFGGLLDFTPPFYILLAHGGF